MDRRTLIAMVLCFLIFLGWQKLYIEPHMPHTLAVSQAIAPVLAPNTTAIAPSAPIGNITQPTTAHPTETRVIPGDVGNAILGDGNRAFVDWSLKSYKLGLTPETASIDLKSVTNQDGQVEFAFDDPAFAYLSKVQGTFENTPPGIAWKYEDANIRIRRDIMPVDGQPYMTMTMTTEFKNGHHPSYFFLSLDSKNQEKDPEAQDRQLVYWSDKSLERIHLKDTIAQKDVLTPVKYIAATSRYFLMTLVSEGPVEPKGQVQGLGPSAGRISMVYPVTGNSLTVPVRVYFGPKELEVLRKVDPALDNTVDLGWFQIFAYPLLKMLKFFYQFVKNYGVAIILLTVLIKLVTYPLNYKSMKSMKEMARLQPQLAKLKEKYKDDKESLNKEMLTLMKTHGYNPAAGCLPMVIQMPIFFALYRVLYSSIELFHAPFALWIVDLSSRDPYYVTPVLLSVTMFLQQKLSPQTATDPAQQKMMQFMPIMFGAFMINLPAGLTLYMLTNALASIVQQLILNKKLDVKGAPVVVAAAR
jgi:YidC/Oxa1 family membrane protein insertase